ncbi:unnamed protein product [Lota lota]
MDLRTLISLLSVMLSTVLNTVVSAPASEVPAASLVSHVRNKRCSCATFLDHECVYFCHLDIIWVNTPERIVSYGLGNMPRRRRSVGDPAKNHGGPRCRCLLGNDSTCDNFCQPENQIRYGLLYNIAAKPAIALLCDETLPGGEGCARTPAAAAARMKRVKQENERREREANRITGSATRVSQGPRRSGDVEDETVEGDGGEGGARGVLESPRLHLLKPLTPPSSPLQREDATSSRPRLENETPLRPSRRQQGS